MITKNTCITFVCNKAYLNYALFIADQLSHQKNSNFDIVICSSENIGFLVPQQFKFIHIETEEFTKYLPTIPRLQKYAYWRIPAIEILSKIYNKIIYLDTDTYINTQNIEDLFKIDLENHVIAAVRDIHQSTRPHRISNEFSALKLPNYPYFNSGMLIINSKEWNIRNFYEKIKSISNLYSKFLYCHDQSLLNIAAAGNWLEISPVWNWQYNYKNSFLTEFVSPKIIHFIGENKIWNDLNNSIPLRYKESYQSFNGDHLLKTLNSNILNKNLFINLLKNIYYFNNYKRYLSKFKKTTSVINHNNKIHQE